MQSPGHLPADHLGYLSKCRLPGLPFSLIRPVWGEASKSAPAAAWLAVGLQSLGPTAVSVLQAAEQTHSSELPVCILIIESIHESIFIKQKSTDF